LRRETVEAVARRFQEELRRFLADRAAARPLAMAAGRI
jgi:hypothetical protein